MHPMLADVTGFRIAFGLCVMGGVGGLSIALLNAVGARLPSFLGRAHGMTGLFGLAILFFLNLRGGDETPAAAWLGLGLLVIALLGGLVVLRTLYDGRPPLWLALGHGGLAVAGLLVLWPVISA